MMKQASVPALSKIEKYRWSSLGQKGFSKGEHKIEFINIDDRAINIDSVLLTVDKGNILSDTVEKVWKEFNKEIISDPSEKTSAVDMA
jgi:hypothetical protein